MPCGEHPTVLRTKSLELPLASNVTEGTAPSQPLTAVAASSGRRWASLQRANRVASWEVNTAQGLLWSTDSSPKRRLDPRPAGQAQGWEGPAGGPEAPQEPSAGLQARHPHEPSKMPSSRDTQAPAKSNKIHGVEGARCGGVELSQLEDSVKTPSHQEAHCPPHGPAQRPHTTVGSRAEPWSSVPHTPPLLPSRCSPGGGWGSVSPQFICSSPNSRGL